MRKRRHPGIIPHSVLLAHLSYNPITGFFVRIKPGRGVTLGRIAGTSLEEGSVQICVAGYRDLAHRLAWFYVYKKWPVKIDHKDGKPSNNALANLREYKWHGYNMQNRRVSARSKSGLLGVSTDLKPNGRIYYKALICFKKRRRYLGAFDTAEEAHDRYCVEKKRLHKFNPVPRNI